MGTEYNPDALRGMILQDTRFSLGNVDTTNSSYQEAGAEPGPVTEGSPSSQRVEALGTLTSDASYDLRVLGQKPGSAIGGNAGGRQVWRSGDDAATTWRGSLAPNKVVGWDHAAFDATDAYIRPHAVTLPDHTVMTVYSDTTNGAVMCSTLSPDDDAWTQATVDSTVPGPACLVPLPSGRVKCIYIRDDYSEGGVNFFTLGIAYSDDKGATWTVEDSNLEGLFIDKTVEDTALRIRAVYHSGFITCLVETYNAGSTVNVTLHHLVSDDTGASWSLVERVDGATLSGQMNYEPFVYNGAVVILYAAVSGTLSLFYVRKTTPRSTLTTEASYASALGITDIAAFTATDPYYMAAAVFDDGLWIYYLDKYGTLGYHLAVARRNPATLAIDRTRWSASRDASTGSQRDNWVANFGDDVNESVRGLSATPYKGGVLLAHNTLKNNALTNNIGALYCGGYSSLDWRIHTFGRHAAATPYDQGKLFIGALDPSTVAAWTVAGAGTTSNVEGGFQITTTANALSVTRNGSTAGNPAMVWARLRVVSGGSLASDLMAIRLRRADGTNDYDISVRFTDTAIRVYDNNAAAQLGSDTTGLTSAVVLDVLIDMAAARAAVYYKRPASTLWIEVASGSLTNDTGTPAADNQVAFGALATGTASAIWAMVGSSIDGVTTGTGVQSFTNPEDLQGRAFSTSSQWLGEQEGLLIRARGGPVAKSDTWTLVSRAQYGLQNIHPEISPSPDIGWRTPLAATAQTVIWNINSTLATRLLSTSIGMYVSRANMRTLYFEGRQVGTGVPGTWDTLITIDQGAATDGGNALTADLDGNWLRPTSSTPAAARMFEGGELVNGYVHLSWTGGGGSSPAVFKVLENTEGIWGDPATTRAVELLLEGDTSAISGTITAEIWAPSGVGISHGVDTEYDGYRLRIAASQDTYEGDYRVGLVVIGPLLIFGRNYDHGRVVIDEAIVEEYEISGTVMRRALRDRTRRSIQVAWTSGIETFDTYDAALDPEYVAARAAASYDGLALVRDGTVLSGALRRHTADSMVVYLPKLDPAEGAAIDQQVYSGTEFVCGYPSTITTRTSRLGNELEGEIVTWDALTITEAI